MTCDSAKLYFGQPISLPQLSSLLKLPNMCSGNRYSETPNSFPRPERVETLVWPGTLIDSRELSSNLNLLKFFTRVDESFVSFGRSREFEQEFCGQQLLVCVSFPAGL